MQATLVAFYGYNKPDEFLHLIYECQKKVGTLLGGSFNTYPLEQVHATIIGLEGSSCADKVFNLNFRDIGQDREILFDQVIDVWRRVVPFTVSLGGWQDKPYEFENGMKESPYEGSFFIRGKLAGSMGWPIEKTGSRVTYPDTLFQLRKRFETKANVLHRWHRNPEFRDNDFFFRLGVTPLPDDHPAVENARKLMRKFVSCRSPVELMIGPDDLTIVAYEDNKLPWKPDSGNRRTVENISADWLRAIYGI